LSNGALWNSLLIIVETVAKLMAEFEKRFTALSTIISKRFKKGKVGPVLN
jgi:hypothetical protein